MDEIDLQQEIEGFVLLWGPDFSLYPNLDAYTRASKNFISDLRRIMNRYAQEAIKHGAIPEKDVPHRGKED